MRRLGGYAKGHNNYKSNKNMIDIQKEPHEKNIVLKKWGTELI
jgi:hypothetical protein